MQSFAMKNVFATRSQLKDASSCYPDDWCVNNMETILLPVEIGSWESLREFHCVRNITKSHIYYISIFSMILSGNQSLNFKTGDSGFLTRQIGIQPLRP